MPSFCRDLKVFRLSRTSTFQPFLTNENALLHLINDLLELSKFEAGQTIPLNMETNIKKLVQEASKAYLDQFNSKYLSLTVDYKNDIPEAVLTDPQKVNQVLSNILGNALKFTRKGGGGQLPCHMTVRYA